MLIRAIVNPGVIKKNGGRSKDKIYSSLRYDGAFYKLKFQSPD